MSEQVKQEVLHSLGDKLLEKTIDDVVLSSIRKWHDMCVKEGLDNVDVSVRQLFKEMRENEANIKELSAKEAGIADRLFYLCEKTGVADAQIDGAHERILKLEKEVIILTGLTVFNFSCSVYFMVKGVL